MVKIVDIDEELAVATGDTEYETQDQGFAAYLMTRFICIGAVDTGLKMGNGQFGTRKAIVFLVPVTEDMEQRRVDYEVAADNTQIKAIKMFNNMRLVRQMCRQP